VTLETDATETHEPWKRGPVAPGDAPSTEGPKQRKTKEPHGPFRNAVEWILILAAALAVAFVIKQFVVQAFYIPSGSMEKTLNIQDRVLVNKLSYHLHDVHRGDIVVFKRPKSASGGPEIKDLIKRVVALPGETVESRDGRMFINDKPLDEPYLQPGILAVPAVKRQTVPPGTYFLMGDNRSNSHDSRFEDIGPIPRKLIIGRAFVRVWPLSALDLL
jgi:signal peptidase I